MTGPYQYPGSQPESLPQQPFPPPGDAPLPYPEHPVAAYPGSLPPPVHYPKPRRWRLITGVVVALAAAIGVVLALVFAVDSADGGEGQITEARAKTTIQDYLNALSRGDQETVARNSLCGLYDAVKERRGDLQVATLTSDAFRKQFSRADVTSIDKMVHWSPTQTQVLFTMKVVPASTSSRTPPSEDQQAIAQLLHQGKETLVCNYLLRSGSQY
jgi:hypothetical protein